jgi:hypothetical protein
MEFKNKLESNGLSCKIVEFQLDDDFMVVKAKIEDVFPQLTDIGGYEFLRVPRSKRDLITIPASEKGYDVKTIKTAIGSGKLYLRPVQASIELHESVVNLNCMSKEKCRNCDLMVYLHLLKDHRQDCLKSKAPNVALTNVVVQACCSSMLPKRKAIQPVLISSDEEDDDELQRTIQESLNFERNYSSFFEIPSIESEPKIQANPDESNIRIETELNIYIQ